MNWIKATGAAINIAQLFINFPLKKLKITCEQCEKVINNRHRDKLLGRVFKEHYKIHLFYLQVQEYVIFICRQQNEILLSN